MRNFSTQVTTRNTLNWEDDWDPRGVQYEAICTILSELMEATPGFLCPSEERVISDFQDWTLQASGKGSTRIANNVFFYANINTGKSLVVVACAGKVYAGQMRFDEQLMFGEQR